VFAVLPAHALAELGVGMGLAQMLLAFATNVLVSAMSAAAVRYFLPGPPWLRTVRSALIYILVGVVVSPAFAALPGAFVRMLGNGSLADYGTYWTQWYASNALGAITLGSLFMTWYGSRELSALPVARLVEPLSLGVLLIGVSVVAFDLAPSYAATGFLPAVLYAPLPILMWITIRFGTRGASAAIMVLTAVSIIRSLHGSSMFALQDPETNVLAFQLFLLGVATPLLLLGASVEQARDAEQSVRDRESQITFAAKNANIGFWQLTLETGKLWLSDHCASMLGLSTNEPPREAVFNVIHHEDRDNVRRSMRQAIHDGKLILNEFRCVMSDGRVKWFLVRSHPERSEQGRIVRVSGYFADITTQKALEAEAAVKNKELTHLMRVSMLGELSGAIAHELHQPLTAILSNAEAAQELITQNPPSLHELTDILQDIIHEDARAGQVIDRMRRLMKKSESSHDLVDVNALIEATLALLNSDMIQRRIKVETALEEPALTTFGDPIQLQQVFLNLILNANEAMSAVPAQDRILTVATRQVDGKVELTVSDRGPGLQAEARHRAFEPFFSTKDHGLGLGLSICSTIIASHGGTMQLNDHSGRGTTATVRLPKKSVLSGSTVA
jgi:PAS domain S-box-containing protein